MNWIRKTHRRAFVYGIGKKRQSLIDCSTLTIRNGGFAEYATEKALSPEDECVDLNLTFSARDENGKEIKDSEEHIPMRTQVVDAEGNCYAQVDWFTGINDFFDWVGRRSLMIWWNAFVDYGLLKACIIQGLLQVRNK